jgi:hypothetical protein
MANNVVSVPYLVTGAKLYGVLRNDNGKPWNGSAFETYVTANLATYDLALTEQGTASKVHTLTFPTAITGAGWYSLAVYVYAVDGTPAESDVGPVWMQDIYWTGSAVTPGPITAPDDPAQCTGYLVCYDEDGNAESGVEIKIRQTAVGSANANAYAFDSTIRTEVSDANGLVQFTGLWQLSTYKIWRGLGTAVSVTIPEAATYALPSVLGER